MINSCRDVFLFIIENIINGLFMVQIVVKYVNTSIE